MSGARRRLSGRWPALDLVTLLLVVGFVVVSIGPALVGARMMLDVDLITRFPPFTAIDGVQTASSVVCRGDTVDGVFPSFVAAKQQLFAGDLQTWVPWESGGGAFAALPSNALFSPLTLPYYVLPVWLAPAFVKLLEMVVGVVGMVGLARRHGMSRAAGLLGGAVFSATGFMTMWTNWPHPQVAALIPVLFWALECTVQERRARYVVGVALALGSMLLGGFPAIVLYTLTLGGPYVLVRALQRYGVTAAALGALARAAGGVVLGVALTAVQLVPFVFDLQTFTSGRQGIGGIPLPTEAALTTFAPSAFGLCRNGERFGQANPIEGVGFIGAAALLLALLAVARPPRARSHGAGLQWFGIVALPLTGIVIWIGGPLLRVLQAVPFYSDNPIGRAQSVFGFLAAVMCAVGFEQLIGWRHREAATRSRPVLRGVWAALVVLTVLGFLAIALSKAFTQVDLADLPQARDLLDRSLLLAVALAAAAALLILVAVRRTGRWRTVALAVLVVLALGQSAYFLRAALPDGHRKYLYPVTPTHAFLLKNLGHQRYDATGNVMFTGASEAYRIRSATGHQFTQGTWVDLLRAVDPGVMKSRTYSSLDVAPGEAGQEPVLDQLGVKYWVGRADAVTGRLDEAFPATFTGPTLELATGSAQTCALEAGPLRAVQVQVAKRQVRRMGANVQLHVRVETPRGVLTGAAMLPADLPRGSRSVPVVGGADLARGGSYRTTFTLTGSRGRPLVLSRDEGAVRCRAVRPTADGLRLVSASAGAVVYRRLDALPRVRWAGSSRVVADPAERVRLLARGVPSGTVLLDDASQPAGRGGKASVEVTRDSGAHISATVRAESGGYVVVADAVVRRGWSATVDGKRVSLVHGNHAFGAVHVPAGRHRVDISYDPPGLRAGALISGAAGLVTLGLLVGSWWWSRRKRDRPGQRPA